MLFATEVLASQFFNNSLLITGGPQKKYTHGLTFIRFRLGLGLGLELILGLGLGLG